jgi:hypothetical protein
VGGSDEVARPEGKDVFFEKKQQKTLTMGAALLQAASPDIQKSFCNCPGIEIASKEG